MQNFSKYVMKTMKNIAKARSLLFCTRKTLELMPVHDRKLYEKSTIIFWTIVVSNFISLVCMYGDQDQMSKMCAIMIMFSILVAFIYYVFETMMHDVWHKGFPMLIVHYAVPWIYGLDIMKLDEKCVDCGCKNHAMIYCRSDYKDNSFSLLHRYDELTREEDKNIEE